MSFLRCQPSSHQVNILRQAAAHASRPTRLQHRVLFTHAPSRTRIFPFASGSSLAASSQAKSLTGQLLPSMATVTQSRAHSGHSHGQSHDTSYLTSTNLQDAGVRITRLGLYVNVAMAISKGIGGYCFNSQALTADGVHALTDLASDFLTLASVSFALRPPTKDYPNGFGRAESLGSVAVSSLLLGGGLLLGLNALGPLYAHFLPDLLHQFPALVHLFSDHGHGLFGHSHSHGIPNLLGAWIAAGSIVVKEWLYRRTMAVANERKSSVLASNAIHHRVDCFTSLVALIAIVGPHVLGNAAWLDPVGSLLVAAMIIRAGSQNTWSAVKELMDMGLDVEVKELVRKAAMSALASKNSASMTLSATDIEIKDVQGTKAGQNYLVEVVLAVPGSFSTFQTHQIEHDMRKRIGAEVRRVRKVRVKFVPKEEQAKSSFMDDFVGFPASNASPEHKHDHHSHDSSNDNTANGGTEARKRR